MVQIIRMRKWAMVTGLLKLYIPHGSDNTMNKSHKDSHYQHLYIPHGSDNTPNQIAGDAEVGNFISHMVQIIPGFLNISWKVLTCFISHMVQIILVTSCNSPSCSFRLYIPHGSDNTPHAEIYREYEIEALYPTWFR